MNYLDFSDFCKNESKFFLDNIIKIGKEFKIKDYNKLKDIRDYFTRMAKEKPQRNVEYKYTKKVADFILIAQKYK